MPDGPENDYFATQFATAIVQESNALTQYWFGRQLRFLGSNEFVFKNFFREDYTESEFVAAMKSGAISISTFDITNVSYDIDTNDPDLAVVTMDVYIEATIDSVAKNGTFTLTHKVKRAWQTYESELS